MFRKFMLIVVCFVTGCSWPVFSQKGSSAIRVTQVARVTGQSLAGEKLPNPNQSHHRYDLGGTDLGIAWRMGNGALGLWFGDSYGAGFHPVPEGGPGAAGNWRSNLLAFSADSNLADGLVFTGMYGAGKKGSAKAIISSAHQTDGTGSHTAIPTAAVHAAGREFVHYMDIRKWLGPGRWTTNFSGLYSSEDHGTSWAPVKNFRLSGQSAFAQVAFAAENGYVYILGTPAGRWGSIRAARVKEKWLGSARRWAYWNGNAWIRNQEQAAVAVVGAPAGELSLAWHPYLRCWLLTYLNEKRGALVLRRAPAVTGPWSEEEILATQKDYPGLYGAFIFPAYERSGFYFLMSLWKPYNVFLMKASW